MSDARPDAKRCPAVKKNGEPCTASAGATGFCVGNSPYAPDARRKGGAATSRAARAAKLIPARLRPVADTLELALQQVHDGSLEPRKATAMAALAGALVKVVTTGELEQRLRALEQRPVDGKF